MDRNAKDRWIVWLLRLGGTATGCAVLAVFLPTQWMVTIHQLLGMGALPEAPITEYLTRSLSAMYAMHGGLLWVVSFNVPNYRPLINYLALSLVGFGILIAGIDFVAGMPPYWLYIEGPFLIVAGTFLYQLNREETVP